MCTQATQLGMQRSTPSQHEPRDLKHVQTHKAAHAHVLPEEAHQASLESTGNSQPVSVVGDLQHLRQVLYKVQSCAPWPHINMFVSNPWRPGHVLPEHDRRVAGKCQCWQCTRVRHHRHYLPFLDAVSMAFRRSTSGGCE